MRSFPVSYSLEVPQLHSLSPSQVSIPSIFIPPQLGPTMSQSAIAEFGSLHFSSLLVQSTMRVVIHRFIVVGSKELIDGGGTEKKVEGVNNNSGEGARRGGCPKCRAVVQSQQQQMQPTLLNRWMFGFKEQERANEEENRVEPVKQPASLSLAELLLFTPLCSSIYAGQVLDRQRSDCGCVRASVGKRKQQQCGHREASSTERQVPQREEFRNYLKFVVIGRVLL